MLIVTDQISVAANTTDQNILQTNGNRVRTVPQGWSVAKLTYFSSGSAAGLEESVFAGNQNPLENSRVSAQNRIPVMPDDMTVTDIYVKGGEQLQISVTNTTGGALTHFYRVELEDVSAAFGL